MITACAYAEQNTEHMTESLAEPERNRYGTGTDQTMVTEGVELTSTASNNIMMLANLFAGLLVCWLAYNGEAAQCTPDAINPCMCLWLEVQN